jgi:dihydropteroate synthase
MTITAVMGVLNVTPDSFYDGGRYLSHDAAIRHGLEMIDQGADLIDVGGESSRPGALPVDVDEEIDRVLPVIHALASQVRISIDTMKREVATAALRAGATLVNDVSASLADVAARHRAGLIVMHMKGRPPDMQRDPRYDDVVREVSDSLVAAASLARSAGVEEVYIDPGIGFGKTREHNLALLAGLDRLVATGWPVVVGTSRKSFLGAISAPDDEPLPAEERFEASLATAVWAMAAGVAMVRVHDVRATHDAARVVGEQIVSVGR